jgi:hypothetical protein
VRQPCEPRRRLVRTSSAWLATRNFPSSRNCAWRVAESSACTACRCRSNSAICAWLMSSTADAIALASNGPSLPGSSVPSRPAPGPASACSDPLLEVGLPERWAGATSASRECGSDSATGTAAASPTASKAGNSSVGGSARSRVGMVVSKASDACVAGSGGATINAWLFSCRARPSRV